MSQRLDESRLRFEFGSSWQVLRYDGHSAALSIGRALSGVLDGKPEGTKSVDFVAVHEGELYLFEVKNFASYERESRRRLEKEIHLEIGLKVRDTLAGLLGGVRCGKELPGAVRTAVEKLAKDSQACKVVVWLERDSPPAVKRWVDIGDDPLEDRIKSALGWLNARVALWSRDRKGLPDLRVSRLP